MAELHWDLCISLYISELESSYCIGPYLNNWDIVGFNESHDISLDKTHSISSRPLGFWEQCECSSDYCTVVCLPLF